MNWAKNMSMGELALTAICHVVVWTRERSLPLSPWMPTYGRWESCTYPSPAAAIKIVACVHHLGHSRAGYAGKGVKGLP